MPTKVSRAVVAAAHQRLPHAARVALAEVALSVTHLKGFLFEVTALNHFASSSTTFSLFSSLTDPPLIKVIDRLPAVAWDTRKQGATLPDDNKPILLVLPPYFPTFDAVIYTSTDVLLLQITTAFDPNVDEQGFQDIFSPFPP
ncbi:hypothetical protein JCM11251_004134 [Rhodosporidiobolus azoricus]